MLATAQNFIFIYVLRHSPKNFFFFFNKVHVWVAIPVSITSKDCFLRYPDPEDRNLYCIISDISVMLRETPITISDSIEIGSPVDSEIVRVLSLRKTAIAEITRFKKKKEEEKKKPIFRVGIPKFKHLNNIEVAVYDCSPVLESLNFVVD